MTAHLEPREPPPLHKSIFGYKHPELRAAQLPGMVAVPVRKLFPDVPEPLMEMGQSADAIAPATRRAMEQVDLSRIGVNDTVNLLCSEHGFAMMGGEAYAKMLVAVREIISERTGNTKIRLAFSAGSSKLESAEIIETFGLKQHFEKIISFGPYDRGVEIETEIGTLYGIGQAYKAQHLIYCHYDDPRETHFHRLNGRALKAFTMSYARIETRAIFHNNFPTSSANIVPRALYESDFIQKKFCCVVMLRSAPSGIMGVDAENDLLALDKAMSKQLLHDYGKMIHLMESIDECIVVLDGHRWLHYQHAGGTTACNLFFGDVDHLDLDYDHSWSGNPAVKAVVMNYAWKSAFPLPNTPIIASSDKTARSMKRIIHHTNVQSADSLADAMDKAYALSGTRKAIIFDGAYGVVHCTPEMADYLCQIAPDVSRAVDEHHLPKWLAQRGLN